MTSFEIREVLMLQSCKNHECVSELGSTVRVQQLEKDKELLL